MTPEVAKKLLPLVNTKKTTDALELYMEERVKDAQKILEQSTDILQFTWLKAPYVNYAD